MGHTRIIPVAQGVGVGPGVMPHGREGVELGGTGLVIDAVGEGTGGTVERTVSAEDPHPAMAHIIKPPTIADCMVIPDDDDARLHARARPCASRARQS